MRRGGAALRRDVFAPLPGEGRWYTALLADGNVGIGGDPVALLQPAPRRCSTRAAGSSSSSPRPGTEPRTGWADAERPRPA